MEPEAVVTMLRQYHERMTAQIFACGGTVEKYIGDAIFAVWGLPGSGEHDAANALRCANGMIAALDDWNASRGAAGDGPLAIGIGLHYGPAVVGDVGSEHSFSFTVIGDTVNTASRLQAMTRDLATPLVVSDDLVAVVGKAAMAEEARLVDELQNRGEQALRGRSGAVGVWVRAQHPRDS
jgi:adenylate cyclase